MIMPEPGSVIPHPLDPLTAPEIRLVAAAIRRGHATGPAWRFASIALAEPAKEALVAGPAAAGAVPRAAEAVCWNREDGQAYRAQVALPGSGAAAPGTGAPAPDGAPAAPGARVTAWEHLPGQQPNMTTDEWHECDEMLRAHPQLLAALAARGLTDPGRVLVDVWAYGAELVPGRYRGRRIGWADVWYRGSADGNPYAHHVTGLHPVVDLNQMELLELEDDPPAGAAPEVMGEYLPRLLPMPLREVSPLQVSQPDGPSFRLDGRLLRWQNWVLRLGFTAREGLVLHEVGFEDAGRLRPVAHRLSFAEMVVPYRDATPDHYRRTAFDIGEWGLGFMTTSLERGCDCLGEITYLDAVVHDARGEPRTIPQAICVHEEDDGIGWKHVDERTGTEVRRARRLVISFHATVANYEYLVYWRFYQDGSIECEVRATGLMVTSYFAEGGQPATGTLVDQRTYAPFHQHFIVARLDLDVDGPGNTVFACDSRALPVSEDNPYGLALVVDETPLRTEAQGRQDYDWQVQRAWKVASSQARNGLGTPTAFKLVPGGSFPAQFDPSSPALRRAEVIGHQLWVTPYHPAERWPCGEFPTLSAADSGLPAWTAADRPIADTDVVLWHVFGLHHITRPEDWPVMPSDRTSFWLKPWGFFDRNPALDVPPAPHDHA
jgi:primary-amine oxidase